MQVYFYVVKTVTPILAPKYEEPVVKQIAQHYNLAEKYGEELVGHLDRVFQRMTLRTGGEQVRYVLIEGHRVWAAIKQALGLGGKPSESPGIIGLLFPEEAVVARQFYITRPDGTPTLMTAEVVLPDSQGILLTERPLPDEVLEKLDTFKIGARTSKGWGLVRFVTKKPGVTQL